MGSAKRRIPNMRRLRGAAHGSARTCARLLFTATDRMAARRKLDQRRDDLCAGGLRKRGSSIASAVSIQSFCRCGVESKKGTIRPVNYWRAHMLRITAIVRMQSTDDSYGCH